MNKMNKTINAMNELMNEWMMTIGQNDDNIMCMLRGCIQLVIEKKEILLVGFF